MAVLYLCKRMDLLQAYTLGYSRVMEPEMDNLLPKVPCGENVFSAVLITFFWF